MNESPATITRWGVSADSQEKTSSGHGGEEDPDALTRKEGKPAKQEREKKKTNANAKRGKVERLIRHKRVTDARPA